MRRPGRRRAAAIALAFAPSLAAGVVGAALYAASPPTRAPEVGPALAPAAGVAVGAALLALAQGLERHVPSFAWASRATDRALARLALPRWAAVALAVATSLGEELLFRGVLLDRIGLVPQALLFGALHPAGWRGWSYPVFAAASGLALGGVVVATGRLEAAVAAHLAVNLVGLLAGGRPRRRAPRT